MAKGYFSRRRDFLYYRYIEQIVSVLASDAKSYLDVGSSDAEYIESFRWIPVRHTVDIRRPYSSPNVVGIKQDFFTFQPDAKYDFVSCFQVLEHIPDAAAFAQHLTQMADRVLVSVPFLWPEGSNRHHVHDPVDLEKLSGWFGRAPDYSIIVEEPLRNPAKGRRLIAYYHNAGEMPSYADLRRNQRKTGRGWTKAGQAGARERPAAAAKTGT